MLLLKKPDFDELARCPYLAEQEKQYIYFLGSELTATEISSLLEKGWRKFGFYFFRPSCPGCQACTPLRVLVQEFRPSKDQRRILRKNQDIRVVFGPLDYKARAFEIYQKHSQQRFSQDNTLEEFIQSFYLPSCPNMMSEYYLADELVGVGYLDKGIDCLSSVYFIFDPAVARRGLGIFSILKEIEYAAALGLKYYYLGYYIAACQRMRYKDKFLPRQYYDWTARAWKTV